ncbi:MAG: glycosyltransferase family 87 protein [Polyangia bacterium]
MSPRTRFAAAFAYCCAAVAASVWFLREAFAPSIIGALKSGGGDCVINWLGARAWRKNLDIFSPEGLKWAGLSAFGHAPTTPLWYLPFTPYDIYDLTQIFGHFLIFILLIHMVLVAAELRAPVPLATGLVAFALVMDAQWWVYHVTMIQLSEPIAFLYVLAWICLRRDHEIASGLLIGLACTMKAYAGLLLLLLAVGRRWKGVAAGVAVFAAFFVAASWGFGLACWREYLKMLREIQQQVVGRAHNASLDGILVRAWPARWSHGAWVPRAMLVGTLLSILIIGVMAWAARKPMARKPKLTGIDDAVDLPFALFTVASVWLNPVAWEHYNATLLFPVAVAVFAVWRQRGPARVAWIGATTALVLFVAWLLSINMYSQADATTAAAKRWYEIANWLPWPIMLGLLGALMWRADRLSAAAEPA